MNSKLAVALGVVIGMTVASPNARAGLIFGDGLIHTLSGQNPDVTLLNGSGVVVPTGASVVAPAGLVGVTGLDGADSVTLSGGSITGGAGTISATSVDGVRLIGTFNATAGTVTGGVGSSSPPTDPSATQGGAAVVVVGKATISGGSFTGGAAGGLGTSGGYGMIYNNVGPGQGLTISGGTFTGTAGLVGDPSAHGGIALAATITNGTASITGGTFIGQSGQNFDGLAMVLIAGPGGRASISGGQFVGDLDVFTQPGGLIDFFGTNLQFTYFNQFGYGFLSGTLADGEVISSKVTGYVQDFTRMRTIAGGIEFYSPLAVPEPSSVILLGLGIATVTLGVARRRLSVPSASLPMPSRS